MKRILTIFIIFLLLMIPAVCLAEQQISDEHLGSKRELPRVLDDVGILTEHELQQLNEQFDAISAKYQCDVAVYVTGSLFGYTAESYADDFFDHFGYGWGEADDGILLLISTEARDWHMTTHKFATYALSDAALAAVFATIKEPLRQDEYYEAFSLFGDEVARYLKAARAGKPLDPQAEAAKRMGHIGALLASLLFGSYGAVGKVNAQRRRLKSIFLAHDARNHARLDTAALMGREDRIVDVRRRVTEIPRNTGSKGSGISSGSSTHISSSGRSHGGRGGKF
ncbi:MAG: TPM domain-containing protein [Eubacteriales bacterium]|nr:TPM domain-containing protein [Eubacteriales bacterium]